MADDNNVEDVTSSNDKGDDATDSPVVENLAEQQLRGASSVMVSGRTAIQLKDQAAVAITKPCILLTPIGDAPNTHKLIIRLSKLLDPHRPMGGDVRSLADKFGYTNTDINFLLHQRESATEILLKEHSSCTMVELFKKLKSVGREDAANAVQDYIKGQNCKCVSVDCANFGIDLR